MIRFLRARWPEVVGFLGMLILSAILAAMVGCGRTQVQDMADAKAGAIAYQQESDPAKRASIADGVCARVLAALEQYPLLPRPSRTPVEIRAEPAAYAAASAKAQADPQPYDPADHPAPTPPRPGPLDRLAAYGDSMIRWGLLIGGIAGGLVLVMWAAQFLGIGAGTWVMRLLLSPVVAPILRLAALWGAASAALGAALTWLAAWWWAVASIAVIVGAVLAWIHWRDLRAWWAKRRILRT